jgi:hypothetical protein
MGLNVGSGIPVAVGPGVSVGVTGVLVYVAEGVLVGVGVTVGVGGINRNWASAWKPPCTASTKWSPGLA